MRSTVLGPLPLFLLAASIAAVLTACNATLIGSNQTSPVQPATSDPSKTTPVITWPQPAPITNPAPLTSMQLDATANVPGTFVYSPVAGTVLAAGTQTLTATFTPSDAADYNSATASVTIVVNAAGGSPPVVGDHLAVADSENNRVLIFDAPFTTGMSASTVLGQPGFNSNPWPTLSTTSSSLFSPEGLGVDAAGNVLVVGNGTNRVMQFDPPFVNGMDASLEIGQPSFTSRLNCDTAPPETTLCGAAGVAVDGGGNVWVADTSAGRVLEYQAPVQQGVDPSLVLGQPNLSDTADCDGGIIDDRHNTGSPTANANEFCLPTALQFDSSGDLWVADTGNGRVLEFVPPLSNGMAASLEIGYPASVSMNSPSPWGQSSSIASMFQANQIGLAFDGQGNLWVSDFFCIREFVPPFTSGMSASLSIGTPRANADPVPPTASTMNDITAVAFDASGDLIVSDTDDARVLIFTPPFSAGMGASVAIGQPNMTSGGLNQCLGQQCPPSAGNLSFPVGLVTF